MKVCIIGGTGHIGSQLVPMLVDAGMDVSVVTRGQHNIPQNELWKNVVLLKADYRRQDVAWHRFLENLRVDVLVDLLGVDLPGTYHEAQKYIAHLVACGSFWMYGPPQIVPTPEETQNQCEFEEYSRRYYEIVGIRNQAIHDGLAFTAIMPTNICGPGKIPIDMKGGRNIGVHRAHAEGAEVVLPKGCNTLIAPCDVSDVAQGFFLAITQRERARGEIFNVGPPFALTMEKFIQTYETIYQCDLPREFMDWEPFLNEYLPEPGANYHFREHMSPDILKIREMLGYDPRYTPEESLHRAARWMRAQDLLS